MSDLALRLESLLVASSKPLMLQALQNFGSDDEINDAIADLEAFWRNRGMVVHQNEGFVSLVPSNISVQMLTQLNAQEGRKLTEAAVETLCYIALNQPVTLKDIEHARGVKLFKGLLDSLLDAGFVRAATRKTDSGRALVYVTTEKLLEHFGLSSVADLPTPEELDELVLLRDFEE